MSRYARRTDANHAAIVAVFRALGCTVVSTAGIGGGFPDLVVLHWGQVRLVEVKDGRKARSARKLTPLQQAFVVRWPVSVVESVDDARRVVEQWRGEGGAESSVVAGNGPNSHEVDSEVSRHG